MNIDYEKLTVWTGIVAFCCFWWAGTICLIKELLS